MTDIHDNTTKADARSGKKIPPYLVTLTDKERDVRYFSNDGLLEPANGWLWKQCTADSSTTSFSFDQALPANVHVVNTAIYVAVGLNDATITVALGKSGTTGAYQVASSFTNSMGTTGAKASTTVKAHETASVTPLVTLSAAPTAGKILAGIQYAKAPAIV